MKTAIHYGLTPAEDEVWLILTADETLAVRHRLRHGEVQSVGIGQGAIVIMTAHAARNTARDLRTRDDRLPPEAAARPLLDQLATRLAYDAEWLERADTTTNATRVAEARAGAGA